MEGSGAALCRGRPVAAHLRGSGLVIAAALAARIDALRAQRAAVADLFRALGG